MTKPSPTLPNPFLEIQTGSHSPMLGWFGARPAWVVLLLCLGLGLPIVGWRANWQADDARARARAEALARSMALELQFDQAVSAVETLGVLARQSGGTIPNFQRAAAEVLATTAAWLRSNSNRAVSSATSRPAQATSAPSASTC